MRSRRCGLRRCPMTFEKQLGAAIRRDSARINRKNEPAPASNGVFQRYVDPVLTAGHVPVSWRYDLNPVTNPFFMERLGVNAAFNPGAIFWKGSFLLVAR